MSLVKFEFETEFIIHPANIYLLKAAIETLEKGVKYFQI